MGGGIQELRGARVRWLIAAAVAVGLGLSVAAPTEAAVPARCTGSHWVGAWGAAPAYASMPGYTGQTLRMVVTPAAGWRGCG